MDGSLTIHTPPPHTLRRWRDTSVGDEPPGALVVSLEETLVVLALVAVLIPPSIRGDVARTEVASCWHRVIVDCARRWIERKGKRGGESYIAQEGEKAVEPHVGWCGRQRWGRNDSWEIFRIIVLDVIGVARGDASKGGRE